MLPVFLKSLIPQPMKTAIKRIAGRPPPQEFSPYLKRKNVEGVVFDFWIGDPDGRDWYDRQCTDPVWMEMRFIRDHLVKPVDVVLECGGHHGCTAIVLSHWVGRQGKVITFEALPGNCDIIARNIAQNRLENVRLERKAVGAARGKVTITPNSNSSVAASGQGIEVELTCLDEYADLKPTVLKLDVEGFEEQVLLGSRKILATRPKLAIEVHVEQLPKYGATVEGLLRLIDAERYRLWIQREDGATPEEYRPGDPLLKRAHLFGIPRCD